MLKLLYRWHRVLSIIIAIPVLLWAISGFMHPIMSTIRPAVRLQQLPAVPLDTAKVRMGPGEVLSLHGIDLVHDLRVVHIGSNFFYQVQLRRGEVPAYFSTADGRLLRNGDDLYARHLARQFLEGVGNASGKPMKDMNGTPEHDCCVSATRIVMDQPTGAPVTGVERLVSFTDEYDEIQRILPAYQVKFGRADGIRIYVETIQDRFVHAVDDRRAAFDRVFSWFHTWDWATSLGKFRYLGMVVILLMAMLSAGMGLWIFFNTRTLRPKGNPRLRWRFNHRVVSLTAALFTLMFSFSGAYHALSKLSPDLRSDFHVDNEFKTKDLMQDPWRMVNAAGLVAENVSLVRMNDSIYWRVVMHQPGQASAGDARPAWSKDRKTAMPSLTYFSLSGHRLANGERSYAASLAAMFAEKLPADTALVVPVMKFEGEYGFVNKRLPVWKVQFSGDMDDRFYVETTTGQLSVRVSDADLPEGYSFSFLHKHHFMDFGGKVARDLSTMFWAAMQVAMIVVGFILYVKTRKK